MFVKTGLDFTLFAHVFQLTLCTFAEREKREERV
jgi:hypothetical protein